jgi:hypothetical protein
MDFPLSPSAARFLRHPVALGPASLTGCAVAGVAAVGVLVWWFQRPRPTPEEIETARRDRLAAIGRIIDGTVTDALPSERDPQTVLYEYRIAGVTYECAQDVSPLQRYTGELRVDLPVQVRYDPDNPGNSIVVAESWNGLWHWEHHALGEDESSDDRQA